MKQLFFLIIVFLIVGCTDDGMPDNPTPLDSSPNILLIIADDLGKDALEGFEQGTITPSTPHIDGFRTSGLSFTNFWSYPTCSPTRASILTGKYGYRTGVKWAGDEIDLSELSLQQYINDQSISKYATAIIGKWHLSGSNTSVNPEVFGIDYYSGLVRGEAQSYYNWLLTEDTQSNFESEYTTTKFTDLAIDWISQQEKPWFMWLAYNAPHTPFHVPPGEMHSQGDLPQYTDGMDPMPYYIAAIEAMDFQIGRLIANLTSDELENTIIIFIGDNGSPNEVSQSPFTSSTTKGTLYQGGINVPMFISGNGVSRIGIDENLICSTDLFATISELAGVTVNEINDSKSFKKLLTKNETIRNFQYAERTNGLSEKWAISNGNYKLIEGINGSQELYNLNNDPYEQNNLMNGSLSAIENNIKLELEAELINIRQ